MFSLHFVFIGVFGDRLRKRRHFFLQLREKVKTILNVTWKRIKVTQLKINPPRRCNIEEGISTVFSSNFYSAFYHLFCYSVLPFCSLSLSFCLFAVNALCSCQFHDWISSHLFHLIFYFTFSNCKCLSIECDKWIVSLVCDTESKTCCVVHNLSIMLSPPKNQIEYRIKSDHNAKCHRKWTGSRKIQ